MLHAAWHRIEKGRTKVDWYLDAFRNYAVFTGRSRRAAYWYFVLFNVIVNFGLAIVASLLGALNGSESLGLFGILAFIVYGIWIIYGLAIILPTLALSVRRLHDTDRSGWWFLLNFVPVGNIVLLVFFLLDSTPGQNQYGPNPKGAESRVV
jgi:uncharacterized membrane protein YhaH (DUF805 family)